MKKEIKIGNQVLVYDLRKYRRPKNIRLVINRKGLLVASKPWYLSQRILEDFIKSKILWITASLKNHPGDRSDEYKINKDRAKKILTDRVNYFNQYYNFNYNKLSVRNTVTRWGSCSSKANLSFSYRAIFLPDNMLDYIVVHELCHLKELNHSAKFWELVAEKAPNYLEIRRELKKIM